MLLPVFQDLIKPQWRGVLETLKRKGGMAITELAEATDVSYMGAKAHCEALTEAGYLIRTRLPRTEVGRPEILYNLSAKANALFPQAGIDFTLELLEDLKRMFGESAPEKLLFQYFQRQRDTLNEALRGLATTEEKANKLASLREKAGHISRVECGPPLLLVELHHPLQAIFQHYPHAATMELRMFEELLGGRIRRSEEENGRESPPTVVFEIH